MEGKEGKGTKGKGQELHCFAYHSNSIIDDHHRRHPSHPTIPPNQYQNSFFIQMIYPAWRTQMT